MIADEFPGDGTYELAVFGNRDADFLAGKAVWRHALPLARREDETLFNFMVKTELRLTPGVYYLVVLRRGSGEPEGVGKVVVE